MDSVVLLARGRQRQAMGPRQARLNEEECLSYKIPADMNERPVAVVGGGTLGRRIAAMFAAGGTDVRIFDVSEQRARRLDDPRANRGRSSGGIALSKVLVSGQ